MRRPFIFFLIIISIYCWLADCFNLLFYLSGIESANLKGYCAVLSILVLLSSFLIIKRYFFKSTSLYKAISWFRVGSRHEWLLLSIVSLPIVILGLFRSVLPDQNFDTLHYELYLQEFDFRDNQTNYAPGSLRSYFFPLSERIFAIFRHILGYRLGTILNTFLLVIICFSVYDFFKKVFYVHLSHQKFPEIAAALLSLFAIFSDNTFFTIGSYKTDLIGVPFLLELIHIIFFPRGGLSKKKQHYYFFLVASLTLAYKLTYLPYIGILSLIYVIQQFRDYSKADFIALPCLLVLFPGVYIFYNLVDTGNPIFPLYNDIFHSEYYPPERFKDLRWGLRQFHEIFTFHIVTYFDKTRANEWSLYSYRLLIGYLLSFITVIYYFIKGKRKNNSILRLMTMIAGLAILFDYSCVITTGYFRYGSIIEILYGILLGLWFLSLQGKLISVFVFALIFLQSFVTFDNIYLKNINISWHSYNQLMADKTIFKTNANLLLEDHDDVVDESKILPVINGFVSLEPFPQDGLAKLLAEKVPIYDLSPGSRTNELTSQVENALRARTEKEKLVTVASIEALNQGVVRSLNARGFLVSNFYEVYPSFFRFGEPVFILQLKYLDTSLYNIKSIEQYLRDENPVETRNDFTYNTGNHLKAFIREAPFAFSWNFLPQEYNIVINEKEYSTKNRFGHSKILSSDGTGLKIHKPNSIPYLIIIQEIEEKRKL